MRLNTKTLTQFKAPISRLRLPLLVMLIVLMLALLAYGLIRSASNDIIVRLTPTPLAAEGDTNDAALTLVAPHAIVPQRPTNAFHLSLAKDSAQTVGSVSDLRDEDILSYDGVNFALVFDGSAAGLPDNADVDAFHFVDADTILISFDKPISIDSLKADDADIVKFEATSLGPNNTAGTFSLFLDGAAVGLRTNRANVDALALLPDGTLLISTEARVKVAGVNGNVRAEAEDILAFTPSTPGDYSSGDWSLYFDGSNVDIRNRTENIDGLALGPEGKMYLSTTGKFSVKGIAGGGEDIFIYAATSLEDSTIANLAPTLFFDGRESGLNRNDIDAISVP